jgi:small subunit ribosomal protein S6
MFLRDYELTVIVSPQVDEENLKVTIDKLSQWVKGYGGNIVQIEPQGKRRLAYPIKKHMEGNYILAKFQGESKLSKELEANLKMSEDILRYLLVKVGE